MSGRGQFALVAAIVALKQQQVLFAALAFKSKERDKLTHNRIHRSQKTFIHQGIVDAFLRKEGST